jgi:hypothetical protein
LARKIATVSYESVVVVADAVAAAVDVGAAAVAVAVAACLHVVYFHLLALPCVSS